jgi:hypothetical protein
LEQPCSIAQRPIKAFGHEANASPPLCLMEGEACVGDEFRPGNVQRISDRSFVGSPTQRNTVGAAVANEQLITFCGTGGVHSRLAKESDLPHGHG